jgi:TolA-binding protein
MSSALKSFLLFFFVLSFGTHVIAQSPHSGSGTQAQTQSRIRTGINLYSQGKWHEAVQELRRAQAEAPTKELRGEALFWISLSELSAGEYEASLRDMDALEETDPGTYRLKELPYHRARVLYYLGRFDEAIILFRLYADAIFPADGTVLSQTEITRKASAYYWIGECLYSMGQLDRAGEFFRLVTDVYPGSSKYEASSYRLAMINQKKVETELLALLQWSHEESLKNMEEFRRKESAYDQAMSAYQKRINDMLKDTRLQDLEDSNSHFREQLILAEERIRSLESSLRETSSTLEEARDSASVERLRSMKSSAQGLENLIRENSR